MFCYDWVSFHKCQGRLNDSVQIIYILTYIIVLSTIEREMLKLPIIIIHQSILTLILSDFAFIIMKLSPITLLVLKLTFSDINTATHAS